MNQNSNSGDVCQDNIGSLYGRHALASFRDSGSKFLSSESLRRSSVQQNGASLGKVGPVKRVLVVVNRHCGDSNEVSGIRHKET